MPASPPEAPPSPPQSSPALRVEPPPPPPPPRPPPAPPATSTLIDSLKRLALEHPLDEKVLLAPSLLVGHQIVERLARSGGLVLNLRVETLRTLAHAVAGPAIAREGARLLSRAQALALIEEACAKNLDAGCYFGALADRPGFHRAIQHAFDELRAAGLAPGSLPAGAFADPRKPRELRAILESYESALRAGNWVDRAEVLRRATELAAPSANGPLFLLPEALDLSPMERRFLERLSGNRLLPVPADAPETWAGRAGNARVFRAAGEENEIRAVFRWILASGIPFDQAEVLHTDAATYPALAFELAAEHGVPCTFAGGIAAAFTRPARAALAYLRWIGNGFQAEILREALASGVLTLPKGVSRVGPLAAAREMRRAGIGWGRERHLAALERRAAEISFRKARPEEDEDSEARKAWRERRLAALAGARTFLSRALSLAPVENQIDLGSLSRGARDFVREFARVTGDLDAASSAALEKLFREFESLSGASVALPRAVARLEDAVLALHLSSDRPRPGRLHFAEFRSGGFSGRPHTFLLGLDEKRHPGGGREDPVLSDEERRQINDLSSAGLPLAPDRSRETAQALRATVARLRGAVTFGYAGWGLRDLANPGEVFPSPFLLDAFRLRAGESNADYRRLSEVLGEGESFVPAAPEALDETEWWLARIGDRRGAAVETEIASLYPWLDDGLAAKTARRSSDLTPWDGVFGSPTPELDPRTNGQPMSASRIQALADCPFGYFLRHVLKLEPPDEPEEKNSEWLDSRTSGSLIHGIFREFLEELTARGRRPAYPDDLEALEALADRELVKMRKSVPPRSELAFSLRREDVRFACRTFLMSEAARAGDVEPFAFEVSFGISDPEKPSADAEPVEIQLGGGRSIRLRGAIDRVDRDPQGQFHIWDYKTGTAFYTHEHLGIAGGKQIQPALYGLAWQALLARRGETADVAGSGYFFPGRKGLGERFPIPYSEEETRKALNTVFDMLAAGAFPHTPDKDSDCFACKELTAFCADREESGKTSKIKIVKSSDPVIAAWRTLRDV